MSPGDACLDVARDLLDDWLRIRAQHASDQRLHAQLVTRQALTIDNHRQAGNEPRQPTGLLIRVVPSSAICRSQIKLSLAWRGPVRLDRGICNSRLVLHAHRGQARLCLAVSSGEGGLCRLCRLR